MLYGLRHQSAGKSFRGLSPALLGRQVGTWVYLLSISDFFFGYSELWEYCALFYVP